MRKGEKMERSYENERCVLGSHDPSMMWDPVTRKHYSYSTDVYMPQFGLNDKIGIPVRSSIDLVHFTYEGVVLSKASIEEGRNNGSDPKTVNFWAPYVEYVEGEYRMYYSATKAFGSDESKIWLATAKSPTGPFENRGIVMNSWGLVGNHPNAIDAHVIWDGEIPWLLYGSFFGGIYIKKLDRKTGLPESHDEKELGSCISRKGVNASLDGPEGASILYEKDTGYFYLFQSYGWLGDTYDIRVGRSKKVTGPYLDEKGKNLVEESLGMKIANSYRFSEEENIPLEKDAGWQWAGFRGPGHGIPYWDPNTQQYYFVHHIRDGATIYCTYDEKEKRNSYSKHFMMVRKMFFKNGWPMLSPEPYYGEANEFLCPEEVEGKWEIIYFTDQSNEQKQGEKVTLYADDPMLQDGIIHWGFDGNHRVICVTGIDAKGIAYWGKKCSIER